MAKSGVVLGLQCAVVRGRNFLFFVRWSAGDDGISGHLEQTIIEEKVGTGSTS